MKPVNFKQIHCKNSAWYTVSFSLLMYYKGTYCFKCCRTAAGKALGRN